jgi:hypothetical protein
MQSRFAAWSMFALVSLVPPAQEPVPVPKPVELTLQALAARRDLWPSSVAPRREVRLSGAPPVKAGEALRLHDLNGSMVVLDTGQFLFDLPAADTDVLERARALLAELTPAQLALTAAELPAKPELWPLRLKLAADVGLENGAFIPAGGDVSLRGLEGGLLSVFDRETQTFFQVEPYETDIVQRARAALVEPPQEPFFVRALEAALAGTDASTGAAAAHPLAGADFVLVYGGRKGCTRCADFVPALQEFYGRAKPSLGGFEALFLSQDATAEDARAYVAEARPPGRVIPFERRVEAAHLATIPGQLLPAVYLFDRAGNLLLRNHPNGGAPSARDVLADLERRLAERAAAAK